MPIGVIVNALSVVIGGVFGAIMGDRLSEHYKDTLQMVFGVCAMGMGISSVILMENMPAVILAMIVGTSVGVAIKLGSRIESGALLMQRGVSKVIKNQNASISEEEFRALMVTTIVLFCASGTGIYGSMVSGMTGEHTILLAKSILDVFTALIFACNIGIVVSLVAIPQVIIFMLLFIGAGWIYPLCSPAMIADFKACGGLLLLATGFRMIKVKMFPIADMIPAMILVMPASYLWATYIIPLVS